MKTSLQLLCCLLLATACAPQPKATPPPPEPPPKPAPAPAATAPPRINHWTTDWTPLFDGTTLSNWAVTDFAGHGPIDVLSGQIHVGMGADLSGITWTNGTLPKTDYEISLEAEKVDGNDFFCGLTFPVGESACSLILGGWGGSVVGLSSLDDNDASENETTRTQNFPTGHWYKVLVRVTPQKIQAWLDQEKIVDVSIAGKKVSLRAGPIFLCAPLGVATYETSAAWRDFKLRLIEH